MSVKDQLNIPDDLLKVFVSEAVSVLEDGHVTFGEIVRLGGSLASKANRLSQLSGHQKQELIVKAVEDALFEILSSKKVGVDKLSDEDKKSLDSFEQKIKEAASFAKDTLPAVLEVAVNAARGKLDLKNPTFYKIIWEKISGFFPCIATQLPVVPKLVVQTQEVLKEKAETLVNSCQSSKEPIPPQNESVPVVEDRAPSTASE